MPLVENRSTILLFFYDVISRLDLLSTPYSLIRNVKTNPKRFTLDFVSATILEINLRLFHYSKMLNDVESDLEQSSSAVIQ